MANLLGGLRVILADTFITTQEGTNMLTQKRIATLAVMTAAAIVPSIGAQAAQATIKPVSPCQLKWMITPDHTVFPDAESSTNTTTGRDPFGLETVEFDDYTYPDC